MVVPHLKPDKELETCIHVSSIMTSGWGSKGKLYTATQANFSFELPCETEQSKNWAMLDTQFDKRMFIIA